MSIKVKSNVILLPSFFIVFCIGIFQFVEAPLPNQNRLGTIPCVRELFGEGFLRESFRKEEDKLSDGEYLGGACKNLSKKDIKNAIKNDFLGTYDYNGEKIKNCLKNNYHLGLFGVYQVNGLLHTLRNRSRSGSDAQTSENQADASGEPEEDTLDDMSELLTSAIYYFFIGICNSRDEEVEFDKVIVKQEKSEVLSCLAECTGKFLERVEHILQNAKTEALTILKNKIEEIKNRKLRSPDDDTRDIQQLADEKAEENEINDLYDKMMKKAKFDTDESANLFIEAYEATSDKIINIEMIKKMAEKYLTKDSEFYHYLHLAKNHDKENAWVKFDYNLYATFSIYQDCSRIQCGMNLNSSPLYNLIVQGSKDSVKNASALQYVQVFLEDRNWFTPKKRIFFKVFVRLPEKVSQTESN